MTEREFSSGGVIIKRHGGELRILLIKDGYGHWTWPKGNIEKGESPPEAAIREIGEEVGLKKIRLIDKVSDIKYFYRLKGRLRFKTVYLYLFEARGEEALKVLKSEIEEAQWLSPEAALEKVEYRGSKEVLKKAIERMKK
jgi:8-oxo-dGTP pyrophosphatase MutT (NUDIX family)